MWARGAVVVNCVLGYVMLIGGGGGGGFFAPWGIAVLGWGPGGVVLLGLFSKG